MARTAAERAGAGDRHRLRHRHQHRLRFRHRLYHRLYHRLRFHRRRLLPGPPRARPRLAPAISCARVTWARVEGHGAHNGAVAVRAGRVAAAGRPPPLPPPPVHRPAPRRLPQPPGSPAGRVGYGVARGGCGPRRSAGRAGGRGAPAAAAGVRACPRSGGRCPRTHPGRLLPAGGSSVPLRGVSSVPRARSDGAPSCPKCRGGSGRVPRAFVSAAAVG